MAVSPFALRVNASTNRHSVSPSSDHLKKSISPALKPIWKELQQQLPLKKIDVSNTVKKASGIVLDVLVDGLYRFVDQPYLPSQKNFAPVQEIGEAVEVACLEGDLPADFPEGVFVRNGPNPQFGCLQSIVSPFGAASETWAEGEGMLHALFFKKTRNSDWSISYKNKYIETETFKIEKQRNKPSFIPAIEGDSLAVLAAIFLNQIRLRAVNKLVCNTNVFEHSGKLYAIAENYLPHEIDSQSLETLGVWNCNEDWGQPCTSHPKKAPRSGELVLMGIDVKKPFLVVGVISVDGKELLHKMDVQLRKCVLSHEMGVTERYNIIVDHPLSMDVSRLAKGGQLLYYDKQGTTRFGVMPRYGDANSIRWFDVETCCTFHLLNTFEDGDEVVVRGCRAMAAILPGPDWGVNKFDWFSRGFKLPPKKRENDNEEEGFLFACVYEWRLNMETGEVKERNLSGTHSSMDFPFVNGNFTGLKNKFGFTQVVDSVASSSSGLAKYGSLAKLYFDEPQEGEYEQAVKVEYHKFEESNYCSGSVFVAKSGNAEGEGEDDGWIVTFVHNEVSDETQVHVIDTKNFEGEPIAKIALPQRVTYGFHGTFAPMTTHKSIHRSRKI
ncbi:carotenoid 9,10(9',10')-cleavage dioxygenase 1-like [Rhodamnia argentea]|uniref:Carotenoid 9,10(9',10')-cleavage dioxygenase 1-like n=1 Tax=Rhodamnia argentea TaxID=178133 RepID=A0ABM3HBK7_9MYRT|nr:carotenoid 9,10(9',10')-cleavage dioxygenase 1-like [Rhodamnia argentea]